VRAAIGRRLSAAAVLLAAALLSAVGPLAAVAHSASDAYLNLTVDESNPQGVLIHGQWDIALRDLDFMLHLDDNGDGRLTWGEVRRHQAAIERLAYASLHVAEAGSGRESAACSIKPIRQMIDEHADGAYASLFFDIACSQSTSKLSTSRPKTGQLTLDYSLFFAIDPSHRGIFVMQRGANIATAVLSPANARITLPL
jgi:hypothetical protein